MSEFEETTEIITEMVMGADQADAGATERAPRWHRHVAVSTLFMALVTAVGALLAGITAHETLLDRTQELIDVSIAQSEQVSIEVLRAKVETLAGLEEPIDPADLALIRAYDTEIEALEAEVAQEEQRIQTITSIHLLLAIAVTLLSVGITLSGMAIIVDQKMLWYAGLALGLVGATAVGYGVFSLYL